MDWGEAVGWVGLVVSCLETQERFRGGVSANRLQESKAVSSGRTSERESCPGAEPMRRPRSYRGSALHIHAGQRLHFGTFRTSQHKSRVDHIIIISCQPSNSRLTPVTPSLFPRMTQACISAPAERPAGRAYPALRLLDPCTTIDFNEKYIHSAWYARHLPLCPGCLRPGGLMILHGWDGLRSDVEHGDSTL